MLTRREVLGSTLSTCACWAMPGLAQDGVEDPVARDRNVASPLRPRVSLLASDGKTPIPLLGLGCAERFPLGLKRGATASDPEALIDYALSHGVNWLDTGYAYHRGASEPFLGRVLKKYPRESYLLSTKMPTWLVKSLGDAQRIFAEQLERCQVDYFDFYLLHSISRKADFERVYVQNGVLDYLIEQKKAGKIRHLGLSYHGKSDYLDELLGTYPGLFEVCLLMLNRMEFTWNPDAPKLAPVAAKHGVGVLVMEPLAGGRAAALRGKAREILRTARPDDTPARWGFRYAASLPGVICIFSGMNRLDYMRENIETLSDAMPPLSDEERATYEQAIAVYMEHKSIPCTGCSYCVPCPYGVRIPEIFAWYNEWAQNGRLPEDGGPNDSQDLRRRFLASYRNTFARPERADRCIGCKKCLVPCPQWTFKIPEEMAKITDLVRHVEEVYVAQGGTFR